jgi:[ribosomal protein S5]-alanine N-acetyltransferase
VSVIGHRNRITVDIAVIMQPLLLTKRLLLRPFMLSDAADVARLAADFAIADTTLNIPHPYEEGMAKQWILESKLKFESKEVANYAITCKSNKELIGSIGLEINLRFDRAELGYWIGRPFWNKGYCTEAGHAMLAYGFKDLKLNRIQAFHFTRNPVSGKVMEKLYMVREGVLRQHVKKWDIYEDVVIYGIVKQDLDSRSLK